MLEGTEKLLKRAVSFHVTILKSHTTPVTFYLFELGMKLWVKGYYPHCLSIIGFKMLSFIVFLLALINNTSPTTIL